jgi:flagellar L-ring protein precursor FlgH
MKAIRAVLAISLSLSVPAGATHKAKKLPPPTAVEDYVRQTADWAERHGQAGQSPGSLYSPQARFADLVRDLRASQVGDLVTIVVSDTASAVSTGATSTARKSAASASVTQLAGKTKAAGPLTNLLGLDGQSKLDGQGTTSRQTTLTTTVSARVVDVLTNGYLVLQGDKDIAINSESQRVQIRGVVRWNDITPANQVRSDRLAALEIRINGKGVVGDAIRRPNFLYRLLLGILPF